MDNRLVLTVLFVTLSWMSGTTYATNSTSANMTPNNMTTNMTTAPNNMTTNMTTAPNNMTTNMTTAPNNMTTNMTTVPNNMTTNMTTAPNNMTTNMTTAPNNMTTNNMTTAPNNMTTNNMTTAPNNMTTNNMTTAPNNMTTNNMTTNNMTTNNMTTNNMTTNNMTTNNMTTNNMTTAPNNMTTNNMTTNNMTTNNMTTNNMTTNNMTTAPNNTTTNNTTTAPATTNTTLITNTTVINLETPVDRTGCGTQQLCGSQPSDCDPSQSSSSCFFVSAKQMNGQNFEFSISGESSGYIASTVSADATVGGNDTTYICANNNGQVKFFSALLDNGKLTLKELPVNSVKGRVSGTLIQCTFVATLDLSTTRAARAANAALTVSTGVYDSSTENLGDPETRFKSGVVDLSDATAAIPNEAAPNNTTTAPATTNTTLITNTTVINLETPVDRTGCGTQQLCGSQPSDCDPSQSSSSCFFVSAKQMNGQNFEFSISGESSGYIASTVSADATVGGNDTTYICANNNGQVKFFSALLDNGKLTLKELPVNSVKGRVSGTLIQCTFVATLDLSTTRAARAANAALTVSTGVYDSSTENLGDPETRFKSGVVDLSDATAAIPNELSNTATTSTTTTTTAHATTFQQSLMQVLLISVGVFTLATV